MPSPGIYRDVPYADYAAWDAYNGTAMLHIDHGEHLVRYALDHGADERTPAKDVGILTHSAILEPERFLAGLVPGPVNERTGKPYGRDTKAFADYEAAHPGKMIAGPNEDNIRAMIASVAAHDFANRLLYHKDRRTEVSACVIDEATWLPLKVRLDCVLPCDERGDLLADLKVSRMLTDRKLWNTAAYEHGWFFKAGLYRRVWRQLRGKPERGWSWVVVENEPPYLVRVAALSPEDAEAADWECDKILRRIAVCHRSGHWPTGWESPRDSTAPVGWLKAQMEEHANHVQMNGGVL
jgi:hypothetical protein